MNCKLNDLAIIVRSEHVQNIGRIVHIDEPWAPACDGLFRWAVSTVGAPLMGYDPETDLIIETRCGCIEDCFLRPITGLPVTDDIDQEVVA
jgi:hypothetical protein